MQHPFDPGYYCSEELRGFGFKAVGENVQVAKNCTIIGVENIEFGDNCRVDGFTTIVAYGIGLRIADYVHVHTNCLLGCRGGIEIDGFSTISHGVRLFSASDDFSGDFMSGSLVPLEFTKRTIAPIVIGKHVLVGAGCTILPGLTIADGGALGAHSLLTRSVTEWSLFAGAPAKRVCGRSRGATELEQQIRQPPSLHPSTTGRSAQNLLRYPPPVAL